MECTDPGPDELLDIFGLVRIPVKDLIVSFIFIVLVINPGPTYPNSVRPLPINTTNTSEIILSTVIRI